MTKHKFLRLLEKKKMEKLPFFSATLKITYIAGYLGPVPRKPLNLIQD